MTHPLSDDELRATPIKVPGRTRYQQYIHESAKRRFKDLEGFLYAIQRGRYGLASEILNRHFISTDIGWLDERIASSWLKQHRSRLKV